MVILTFTDATGTQFGSLSIDAVLSQHHERNADITKHPVEKGADISDHIRPLPKGLNLECIISTMPLGEPGVAPDATRAKDAFDMLDKAMDNKYLVKVQTGLKVYTNMAIKHIAFPREKKTGFSLFFTIEMEEIIFAITATANVPKSALGATAGGTNSATGFAGGSAKSVKKTRQQASSRVAKGNVQAVAPTAKQAAKANNIATTAATYKSGLKHGYDFIAGH